MITARLTVLILGVAALHCASARAPSTNLHIGRALLAGGTCSTSDQCRADGSRSVYCNTDFSQCNACGWYDEPCCNTELGGYSFPEGDVRPNNAFVCSPDSRVFGGVVRRIGNSSYSAFTGPWQGCNEKCTGNGWDFRSVMCLDDRIFPTDFSVCKGLIGDTNVLSALFDETRKCGTTCPSWFGGSKVTQAPFGACTGAGGAAAHCAKDSGTTSRAVSCPNGGDHCPKTSRSCNTVRCASDLPLNYSWKVSEWSQCTADNTTTLCNRQRIVGQLKRTVQCCTGSDCKADLTACLQNLGGVAPNATMECLTNTPCNSTIITCGQNCDLDGNGACCPIGKVDACGVCLGTSTLVDNLGTCCATGVDANGLCCPSGDIDSSGVCDGVNSEQKSITFTMNKAVSVSDAQGYLKGVIPGISFDNDQAKVATSGSSVTVTGQIFGYSPAAVAYLLSKDGSATDVKASWAPVCGNGLCEWGERNSTGRCEKDCPVPVPEKACPGAPLPCSGNGICLAQSGVCVCFAYAFGDDCSQPAYGYATDSQGVVRKPADGADASSCAIQIPLQTPPPTPTPTPIPTTAPPTAAPTVAPPPPQPQPIPVSATQPPKNDSGLFVYSAYTIPTNSPTTPAPTYGNEKKGLAGGYIALIVLGVGAIAAAIGWFAYTQTRPGEDDK